MAVSLSDLLSLVSTNIRTKRFLNIHNQTGKEVYPYETICVDMPVTSTTWFIILYC